MVVGVYCICIALGADSSQYNKKASEREIGVCEGCENAMTTFLNNSNRVFRREPYSIRSGNFVRLGL